MTIELITYTGMANENQLKLIQNGNLVAASAVISAIFKFGDYCVDTDNDPDILYFLDGSNNTVLCFQLGLIPDVLAGKYTGGMLTLVESDAVSYNAWALIDVWMKAWSVCLVG